MQIQLSTAEVVLSWIWPLSCEGPPSLPWRLPPRFFPVASPPSPPPPPPPLLLLFHVLFTLRPKSWDRELVDVSKLVQQAAVEEASRGGRGGGGEGAQTAGCGALAAERRGASAAFIFFFLQDCSDFFFFFHCKYWRFSFPSCLGSLTFPLLAAVFGSWSCRVVPGCWGNKSFVCMCVCVLAHGTSSPRPFVVKFGRFKSLHVVHVVLSSPNTLACAR